MAGVERADDEAKPWKVWCTGGGWWNRSDDRLEVVDRQGVRVAAAVPAHDVERVALILVAGAAAPVPHEDLELAGAVYERLRAADVPLGVRGLLEELPARGQVACRGPDVVAGRLHDETRTVPAGIQRCVVEAGMST